MKKNIKKFLAIILALVCLNSICIPAFAAEVRSLDEEISTYATLHQAAGVNTSAAVSTTTITLYEACDSVRIWGRYFNGSIQNVTVTIIYPNNHQYSFTVSLNSNYSAYKSLPNSAEPGTYTIQFTQMGTASNYEAAIYFYN